MRTETVNRAEKETTSNRIFLPLLLEPTEPYCATKTNEMTMKI